MRPEELDKLVREAESTLYKLSEADDWLKDGMGGMAGSAIISGSGFLLTHYKAPIVTDAINQLSSYLQTSPSELTAPILLATGIGTLLTGALLGIFTEKKIKYGGLRRYLSGEIDYLKGVSEKLKSGASPEDFDNLEWGALKLGYKLEEIKKEFAPGKGSSEMESNPIVQLGRLAVWGFRKSRLAASHAVYIGKNAEFSLKSFVHLGIMHPSSLINLLKNVTRVGKMYQKSLLPTIHEKYPSFATDWWDSRFYMGLYRITGMLSEYARLTGYKIKDDVAMYIGLLTPLYDSFFDMESHRENSDFKAIVNFVLDGKSFNPVTEQEKLFFDIGSRLRESFPQDKHGSFYDTLREMHSAQMASFKQIPSINSGQKLDKEELERVSFLKGGYAMLLFLYAVKDDLTLEEKDAFFDLGAYTQLLDDIEDFPIDVERGIDTLFTRGHYSWEDVTKKKDEAHGKIATLPYDKKKLNDFLHHLDIFYEYSELLYNRRNKASTYVSSARTALQRSFPLLNFYSPV